jgi:hypothetical protein
MTDREMQLAYTLLDYLRTVPSGSSVYKFNVIGRSGKGEFELWARTELGVEERRSLVWIWDELKRLRLITATGTDLVEPDSWVVLEDRGRVITQAELRQMLGAGEGALPEVQRLDPLLQIPRSWRVRQGLGALARRGW